MFIASSVLWHFSTFVSLCSKHVNYYVDALTSKFDIYSISIANLYTNVPYLVYFSYTIFFIFTICILLVWRVIRLKLYLLATVILIAQYSFVWHQLYHINNILSQAYFTKRLLTLLFTENATVRSTAAYHSRSTCFSCIWSWHCMPGMHDVKFTSVK